MPTVTHLKTNFLVFEVYILKKNYTYTVLMEPHTSLQLSWKVFAKDHALDNLDFSTLFTLPIPFCLEFKFYKGYPILRILLLD